MSSKRLFVLVGVVILVILAFFIFKGGYSTPSNTTQPVVTPTPFTSEENTSTASGEIKSQVSIKNFSFDPQSLTIKPGTTVSWVNDDSVPHTIISDPDGNTFKSQTLQPGENFQFTFNTAGTFSYHCSIHPSMQGIITVAP